MGMYIGAATMKNSMKVPQKTKNKVAILKKKKKNFMDSIIYFRKYIPNIYDFFIYD